MSEVQANTLVANQMDLKYDMFGGVYKKYSTVTNFYNQADFAHLSDTPKNADREAQCILHHSCFFTSSL